MAEKTSIEMENLSIQSKNRSPRDLLQRLMVDAAGAGAPGGSEPEEDLGSGEGEEVELNLGLSLGGRFGVDKSDSKLIRSSSIAAISPVVRDDEVLGGGDQRRASHSGIVRTSSLPVATEEEWRKRKELQSLRRLAAKRRRSEKQRSLSRGEREETVTTVRHGGSSATPPLASGRRVSGGATDALHGGGGGATPTAMPAESQGSMSEFESSHQQGSGGSGCEASSLQEQSNQDVVGSSGSNPDPEVRPEPESRARNKGKGIRPSVLEDMPGVFTQGDGPNGRRIEGILYKYGKGEQVMIMCVCHGSFLSPAEFVMHAGGTDVVHPLKHIVINPSSYFS